jgi:phosphoglycolate phosphatase
MNMEWMKMDNDKKIKYFFMDLDGTVTDPKEGITKSVAYALKHYGIQIDNLDSLCKFIGPPLTKSFQQYYGFTEEESKEAVQKYREYYVPYGIYENYLYDGMESLLKNVVKNGGRIVLATSKPQIFAEQILQHFHIDEYFTFIAGSNMDLSRSKKGEVIEYALTALGIPAENVIMIGDREHDIIGARENNLPSIGVTYGYGSREELSDAKADYIVQSVSELEKLMLELLG